MFDLDELDEALEEEKTEVLSYEVPKAKAKATPFRRGCVPAELVGLTTAKAFPASKWVANYAHVAHARCRLICVFGAGDTASQHAGWNAIVEEDYPAMELLLLELPAHGAHRPGKPIADAYVVGKLAADELEALMRRAGERVGDVAFAAFGFSAGATVAHELARELEERGHRVARLFAVARAGPGTSYEDPDKQNPEGPPVDYLRWFSRSFLPPKSAEALEKVIGQKPGDDYLGMIRDNYVADLDISDSIARAVVSGKRPVRPVACGIQLFASSRDKIWSQEGKHQKKSGSYNPPYEDIADTWREWTSGELVPTVIAGKAHHELCEEPVFRMACEELLLSLAAADPVSQ